MVELIEALQLVGTILVFGFLAFALIALTRYKSQ